MKFPAANISIKTWDKDEDFLVYILKDDMLHNLDIQYFQKYLLNHLFVDSNGAVFKIVDRKLSPPVSRWFGLYSKSETAQLIIESTHEKWGIEQVREHILHQVSNLDDGVEHKSEWIEKLKNATTVSDIIIC